MGRGVSGGGGGSRGFSGGSSFRPSGGGIHVHTGGGGFWRGMMFGSIIYGRRGSSSSGSGNQTPSNYKKTRNKLATLLVGLMFLAVCVAGFVCANIFTYKSTNGVVLSYRQVDEYGTTFYYATYQYTVKGTDYTTESQINWTYDGDNPEEIDVYKVGTTQRIKYKNTDPSKIYEADGSDRIEDDYSVVWYIVGVIGLVACVITFAVGINKIEPIEDAASASGGTTTLPEGKVKCQYCGNIIDKENQYCNGCGARRG